MPFLNTFLVIISGYVALNLFKLSRGLKKSHFSLLASATSIFLLIYLLLGINEAVTSSLFNQITEQVVEWGHIIILTLILSSLSIFIRESKPIFARFSKYYAVLPVIIIFSYFLVKDTYALKDWLLFIYQGGALFISFLIYSVLAYQQRKYFGVLAGITMIFLSYVIFWFLPGVNELYSWIWKIILSGGMVLIVLGHQYIQPQLHEN